MMLLVLVNVLSVFANAFSYGIGIPITNLLEGCYD